MAGPENFISNFEPLDERAVREILNGVVEFDKYTEPMKRLLRDFAADPHPAYVVSSAHPRIVDGAPSKNPRYLQRRPDLVNPRGVYLGEIGTRLAREIPADQPAWFPVNAVLSGRRNNPPDPKTGVPPLAVYNPIHYQELPELFMDFICSLTGKSPSTTGFGSEGALTKGPFNALPPVIDINNAFVSAIVTGYAGFTTAAGHIGPNYRMDHDNSMLVPELWCRMRVFEREAPYLIAQGYFEKVEDLEFEGRKVLSSRLGYRMTASFVDHFLGRIFEVPGAVFPEELLRPEKQGLALFVSGVDAIIEAQRLVALNYFEDGSIEAACPPIKALLHIMAYGNYNGMTEKDEAFRALFRRETVMDSDWYKARLAAKQERDKALWCRHKTALDQFLANGLDGDEAKWRTTLCIVGKRLAHVSSGEYLNELTGTIGLEPTIFS
jgi:hypothetical protein